MAKIPARVFVSKTGPRGRPTATVNVSSKLTAAQLGSVLQGVLANKKVYTAAGLRFCDGCKSGLDINIFDQPDIIEVEVQGG